MTGAGGTGPADRAGTEADMGAQHGDGGTGRAGPRPGHHEAPGTEALLAAALRRGPVDAEGERRAVAAFRAARDAEPARAARTRRRDDWRPRERRRAGRPLKTALSVTLASLTLGGVAYAAIGGSGSADESAQPDEPRSSATTAGDGVGRGEGADGAGGADGTEVRPVPVPRPATTAPDAPARSGRPASAQETEEACRALQRLDGRGKALNAAAWEGLVAAVGGDEEDVAAHCAEVRAGDARPDAGDGAEGLVPSVAPAPSGGPADAAGGAVAGTAGGGADAGDDGAGAAGGAGLDAGGGANLDAGDGATSGAAAGAAAGTVAGRSGLSPGTGGQP